MALAQVSSTTQFTSLPGVQFGGSGNPNSAVQVTTITDGSDVITLGLAAQQRGNNPALANDGAGTYFATPGANNGGFSSLIGSKWNFDFYANVNSPRTADIALGGYSFALFYEFDPAKGTTPNGAINLNLFNDGSGPKTFSNTTVQNSENLNFGFLASGVAGVVTPPSSGPATFDPNALGEYTFDLVAYDSAGDQIGDSKINVDVVPDAASTALLLGLTLGGLGAFSRLNQRRSVMA